MFAELSSNVGYQDQIRTDSVMFVQEQPQEMAPKPRL